MKIKILSLLGITLMLSTLGITPSLAQSESEDASEELSPAIMEILCERFPLNSRCVGENAEDPTSSESMDSESMSEPGEDIQGPNAAPDTSPQTPGSEIPDESEDSESMDSESMDSESMDSESMDSETMDTDTMNEPDEDVQGPNAAPDTSPQTPGTGFPE